MNKLFVIAAIVLTPSLYTANANVGVEKLLDSYMVAEVETQQPSLSEAEIKHYPFTIQIASYLNEKDAVSHVEELRAKEKEARYFPAFVRGQIWYKVAIGKFQSRDEAETYKKEIATKIDEPFSVVISLLEHPAGEDVKSGVMTASTGSPATAAAAVSTSQLDDKVRHPSAEAAANETDGQASKIPSLKSVDDEHLRELENRKNLKKAKIVSRVSKETGDHFFSLQVGAYPTQELAKQKSDAMALNVDVFYSNATVKGQNWVRVMVGKFATKKEADEFQKSKGETLHEAFVRRVEKTDVAVEVAAKPMAPDAGKKAQKVSEGSTSEQ